MRLIALAVVSDREGAFPPCGACRQVMAEFGPDAVIIFPGPEGFKEMPLAELLPESFRLD
jgi:cytidine deaminase